MHTQSCKAPAQSQPVLSTLTRTTAAVPTQSLPMPFLGVLHGEIYQGLPSVCFDVTRLMAFGPAQKLHPATG